MTNRALQTRIKYFLLIFTILALLCAAVTNLFGGVCYAETEKDAEEILEENVDNTLEDVDTSALDKFLSDISEDFRTLFGDDAAATAKAIVKGEYAGSFNEFFSVMIKGISKSVLDVLPTVLTLVAIAVLYSLLGGFTSGFVQKPTEKLIYFATYSTMILIVMVEVGGVIKLTTNTIDNVRVLMEGIFPILLTLTTLLGGVTSSAVFKPMMSTLVTVITVFVSRLIIPMFIASIAFSIVGNLTKSVKLDKLTEFFKSSATYILGGVFGIFIAFLTFQGLTGGVIDSISVKTAKFAMQSYIPILGGYLSDGFDLMMASIVLIKNSIGVIGLLMLLSVIVLPTVKIILLSLGLKLASGIIEPISDSKFSKMLSDVSSNMTLLIISLVGVGFMFLLTVMLVIYTCNGGVL